MSIQILGKQRADRKKPVNMAAKLGKTTRDIMKAEALRKSQGGKVSKKVMSFMILNVCVLKLKMKEKYKGVNIASRLLPLRHFIVFYQRYFRLHFKFLISF